MTESYAKMPDATSSVPDGAAAPAGVAVPHLTVPALQIRQVLAAHFVRVCPHIVEIGGAGRPITGFLTHAPLSVTVIDPKITAFAAERLNGRPCQVRHVAAKLQAITFTPLEPYGLVLLGLSLKPFGTSAALAPALLALAAQAQVLVIEHALNLPRARDQIGGLIATRRDQPVLDLTMTIADADLRAAGYDRRRFLAFDLALHCAGGL